MNFRPTIRNTLLLLLLLLFFLFCWCDNWTRRSQNVECRQDIFSLRLTRTSSMMAPMVIGGKKKEAKVTRDRFDLNQKKKKGGGGSLSVTWPIFGLARFLFIWLLFYIVVKGYNRIFHLMCLLREFCCCCYFDHTLTKQPCCDIIRHSTEKSCRHHCTMCQPRQWQIV